MNSIFKKAVKSRSKLRVMIDGASGSGKTYSALLLASAFSDKVVVIDTEHGSASLYSDKFSFDVAELKPPYSPENYIELMKAAELAGYEVLVIDSITQEWKGDGGCLDIHGKMGGNSFTAWAKVTPRHQRFIDAILQSKMHVIVTCRSKTEYQLEEGGKKVTKQGTKAEQRDGLDYEMTTVFSLNQNHMAIATKDRTEMFDGRDHVISADTGKRLMGWLNSGVEAPKPAPVDPDQPLYDKIQRCKSVKDLTDLYGTTPESEQVVYKEDFSKRRKEIEAPIEGAN